MLKIATVFVLCIFEVLQFDQKDYNLIFEYAETIRYNPAYIKYFNIVSFKYNRTAIAANITTWIITDIDNMKLEVQAYKFASNEYRVFPLRFAFDYCLSMSKNDYGLKGLYTCGNLTRCPLRKGKYFACNWIPDGRKFPPFIPDGRYMLDIKYFFRSIEIGFYRLYGAVKKINYWDRY